MIYLKKHTTESGFIIAMCDSDLIDRVLRDGTVEINIKDYSSFYKGELMSAGEARGHLDPKNVCSANIIGKESVDIAIGSSIIDKGSVKKAEKVPYAQAFRVK